MAEDAPDMALLRRIRRLLLLFIAGLALSGLTAFPRLIDCSFGVIGIVPLALADRSVARLAATA